MHFLDIKNKEKAEYDAQLTAALKLQLYREKVLLHKTAKENLISILQVVLE